MSRWRKTDVSNRVFTAPHEERIIRVKGEALGLVSTIVHVHPDAVWCGHEAARSPSDNRLGPRAPTSFIKLPRILAKRCGSPSRQESTTALLPGTRY